MMFHYVPLTELCINAEIMGWVMRHRTATRFNRCQLAISARFARFGSALPSCGAEMG
jgi:hypothetical protein